VIESSPRVTSPSRGMVDPYLTSGSYDAQTSYQTSGSRRVRQQLLDTYNFLTEQFHRCVPSLDYGRPM